MESVDVLIVGGGVAGLSVAKTICEVSNLKVMLVERKGVGWNRTVRFMEARSVRNAGLEGSILQEYNGFISDSPLGMMARFDYGRNWI